MGKGLAVLLAIAGGVQLNALSVLRQRPETTADLFRIRFQRYRYPCLALDIAQRIGKVTQHIEVTPAAYVIELAEILFHQRRDIFLRIIQAEKIRLIQ